MNVLQLTQFATLLVYNYLRDSVRAASTHFWFRQEQQPGEREKALHLQPQRHTEEPPGDVTNADAAEELVREPFLAAGMRDELPVARLRGDVHCCLVLPVLALHA